MTLTAPRAATPLVPRPHQEAAVAAAVRALRPGGRALVVMATGTGKSLVGLWAAEALDVRTVVILVPSLTLADQLLDVWLSHTRWPKLSALAVCSRSEAPERTLTPATIAAHLSGPGRRLVVATYHSSPLLAAAQVCGAAPLDLVVADEAHHQAGPPPGPFGTLARGEIAADRILHMTATPRRVSRPARSAGTGRGLDDPVTFGPAVYDLRLGHAIEAGLLTDYRVVLAGVDPQALERAAGVLPGPVDPWLLACTIAIVGTMGEHGLRRCLSFHGRLSKARLLADLVPHVAAALPGRPSGQGWSALLHSGSSLGERQAVLSRLGAAGSEWGIVSNCRLLGEGVDVPRLDAVAICDPRSSDLELAQIVGRILRRHATKAYGTIIVPILTDDRRDLNVAAGVLRALRAHDERLGSELDAARRTLGRTYGSNTSARTAHRAQLSERLEISLPEGVVTNLAAGIALELLTEATASWEEAYGLLEAWVLDHGDALVPQVTVVPRPGGESFGLGSWCTTQRTRYRHGGLALEYEAALEALVGWVWEPASETFERQLGALTAWSVATGQGAGEVPTKLEYDGVRIGQFANVIRGAYRAGRLAPTKVAALEALSGWSWDARATVWWMHQRTLSEWTATHGDARPGIDDEVDGFSLGRWVTKQRAKLRAGALEPARADALRSLPGWTDSEREDPWWRQLGALRAYLARYDTLPSQTTHFDGIRVGAWVAKQRQRHMRGLLTSDRVAVLEAVPHWRWDGRRDAWSDALVALDRFAVTNGHTRVPAGTLDPITGLDLANWVGIQRTAHRRGELGAERVKQLAARPGWCWNGREAEFLGRSEQLARYLNAKSGLPGRNVVYEGYNLGAWVHRCRSARRCNTLPACRIAALEVIVGWSWETCS